MTPRPELRKLQNRAKDLMRQYNVLPAGDTKERNRLLEELFGTFGRNVRVNQPIYVDYGSNIHLADNSFINMNCTLLDTAPIFIGECAMIGPDVKIYTAVHALDGAERFWHGPGRCRGGQNAGETGTHRQICVDRGRKHHPPRRYHRRERSHRRGKRGDTVHSGQCRRLRESLQDNKVERAAYTGEENGGKCNENP